MKDSAKCKKSNCAPVQLTEESKPAEVPEGHDGGFGWVIVFSCFVIEGYVFGTIRCFSVFLNPFQQEYETTNNMVSWIPSICLALLHSSGMLASQLSKRLGARTVVIIGGLLTSSGFVVASFANNIAYVYLGIGLASGLGFGLAYIPSNVLVGQYFTKRKALAYCITSTGGPVASFVFAPLFQVLVDRYSLSTALRIIAGLLSTISICGISMILPKKTSDVENGIINSVFTVDDTPFREHVLSDIPEMTDVDSSSSEDEGEAKKRSLREILQRRKTFGGFDHFPILNTSKRHSTQRKRRHFEFAPQRNELIRCREVQNKQEMAVYQSTSEQKQSNLHPITNENLSENFTESQDGLQWELLTQSPFVVYCFVGLCIGAGAFTPNVFLVPHVVSRGFVSFDAAILVSIMSGVSIISSLASGWFIAISSAMLMYYDVISLFLLGLSCILCPLAESYNQLVIFCVCFGLFLGATMALPFSVLCEVVGTDCLYSGFAFFMMVTSIAVLITPPFAGWLVDVTGSHDAIFYVSGAALLLASLGVLFITLCTEVSVEETETEVENDGTSNVPSTAVEKQETTSFSVSRQQRINSSHGSLYCGESTEQTQPQERNNKNIPVPRGQRIRRQSILLSTGRPKRRNTDRAKQVLPPLKRRKSLV